jgi:transcriptional regulator with XRE-family HTH domain
MTPAEFKTIRESLGISAEELAEDMGVTRKTVYGFESPSRLIDVPDDRANHLLAIKRAFDAAVGRAARRKSLPRFTDEAAFKRTYSEHLPISCQGALLAAAAAKSGASIDYER